jgi:hypothetical protein
MKNNNCKKGWMILLGLFFILSTTLTSCSCANKPPEGKSAENKTPGDKTAGNKTPEGKSAENKTPGDETAGNKTPESKSAENKTPGDETAGNKTPEGETPENKSPEGEIPENKSPEDEIPENKSPEDEIPENKSSEDEIPENKSPEGEAPENKSPEGETSENKSPEGETPENKSPEGEPAGSKAPESKTAEEGAFPITDDMLKDINDMLKDVKEGYYHFLLQVLQDLKAKKQVDINAMDSEGKTALHYAAEFHKVNVNIFKALVERKADINVKDKYQCTPLMLAVEAGRTDVVKILMEQPGIDINAVEDGQTALYKAAERGYKEIVLLLLNYPGIDISKAYKDNNTLRTARSIAQCTYDKLLEYPPTPKRDVYQEIIQELANRGCNP